LNAQKKTNGLTKNHDLPNRWRGTDKDKTMDSNKKCCKHKEYNKRVFLQNKEKKSLVINKRIKPSYHFSQSLSLANSEHGTSI
jgi:hypothetical protein